VADGLLYGNPAQMGVQVAAILAAVAYSGVVSFVLLKLISLVVPLRASASEEAEGLDIAAHGEEAYMHIGGSTPVVADERPPVGAPVFKPASAEF
jgi:Amt family ammonium transporter